MHSPLEILQSVFGYESFRFEQEKIIDTVMQGQDSFVLMPTGGGKSLCYQIPALAFPGLTVVISPLIALMKDQVDALRVAGISAAYLNSSLTREQKSAVFSKLSSGNLKLLYLAPERLFGSGDEFISFLKTLNVSLFAIDEAHCISQWGHDFRPEYRMLGGLKKEFPHTPIIALTATADHQTRADIIDKLGFKNPVVFVASFNRPNIRYHIEPKRGMYERMFAYLKKHREDAGIVYVLSRASAQTLADRLTSDGFGAKPYHAGLDDETRRTTQEQFVRDEIKIVVATVAFGMGINKSNVRFVIHADLPKNIESYYQETGRAGRDGLPSDALLYFSGGDVMKLKKFAEVEGNPSQSAIMLKKLKCLADMCEVNVCRRKSILNYFGETTSLTCDNCDVCTTVRETFDGTIIAQKAISAVARLESHYGLSYTIDFLRGSKSEKIREAHTALKTYGIGNDISKNDWFRYFKELIAGGFLAVSDGEYPVVKLTQKSVGVLKGNEQIMFTKISAKVEMDLSLPAHEHLLLNDLKSIRGRLAREENMPAYIIFSDATLVELATYLPLTLGDMRKISGFGEVKLAKYGAQFLEPIIAYCATHSLSTKISDKIPKRARHRALSL